MKNWKLVTVTAAALSALVFAAACTVEEGTPDEAAGSGGTGGTTAAGAAGTSAAGAAGEAGAAGAAATSYADALPEACTACVKSKCAAENTACGDVGPGGTGKCANFVSCLETETAKPDIKDYNCAFESCNTANLVDEVNTVSTCTAKNCSTECFVTEGFTCTPLSLAS